MKAVLIIFNQTYYGEILEMMDRNNIRGFTYWEHVQGRGTKTGEPHYGSHAWPTMNSAIMAVMDDSKVDSFLDLLHQMDKHTEAQGLRAFVWNIEKGI